MICPECGKKLTNEEDCYGHDCEVFPTKHFNKGAKKVIDFEKKILKKYVKARGI